MIFTTKDTKSLCAFVSLAVNFEALPHPPPSTPFIAPSVSCA